MFCVSVSVKWDTALNTEKGFEAEMKSESQLLSNSLYKRAVGPPFSVTGPVYP